MPFAVRRTSLHVWIVALPSFALPLGAMSDGRVETFVFGGPDAVANTNALVRAGWTLDVDGIVPSQENCLQIKNRDRAIQSPVFSDVVTNVVFNGMGSASCTRTFSFCPVSEDGTVGAPVATVGNSGYSRAARADFAPLPIPVSARARGFRLVCTGGSQNCYFHSVAVAFAPAASAPPVAPTALASESVSADGFTATWSGGGGYAELLFDLWREEEVPAAGFAMWEETFARCENGGGNSVAIELPDAVCDNFGWEGTLVYRPARSERLVQIGSGKRWGTFLSPALPGGCDLSLLVRARHHVADGEGHAMPVALVSSGGTNELGTIDLGDALADHLMPLPELREGDRILFRSCTNNLQGRVVLNRVALLEDASPPGTSTNRLCEGVPVTGETAWRASDLPEGTYGWKLTAVSAAGERAESAVRTVRVGMPPDVDEDSPPSAVQTGTCARRNGHRTYRAAFETVPRDGRTDLRDGEDPLCGFQLWKGGERSLSLLPNEGGTADSGFYKFPFGDGWALGCYSANGVTNFMGVAFRVDDGAGTCPLAAVTVTCRLGQFGNLNALPETIRAEYRAGGEETAVNAAGRWRSVPSLSWTLPYTNDAPGAAFPAVTDLCARLEFPRSARERRGSTWSFRWVDECPKTGKNAAWGVIGWEVAFEHETGTIVSVR